jgi:hypothetical protein
MESLLGDEEVFSCESRIMAKKGRNFRSDHCIALKFLKYFPEVAFLRIAMESPLGEEEISLH